jgi:DNA replication protein DnaC
MLTREMTKARDKKTKEDARLVGRLLDLGNVPLKFRDCSVDLVPEQCDYRKVVLDWMDNIKEHVDAGDWLFMNGPVGTGKTGAAAIILKEVLLHDGSAFMLTQNELVDYRFNSDHVPFGQYSLDEVVRDSNMLLLDDIGSSRNKEHIVELLEWVFTTRYNNDRSLIVTTNLDPEKEEIKEFLTTKVLSMAMEKAMFVDVSEYDWREAIRDSKEEN